MKQLSLQNGTQAPSEALETVDLDVTPVMNMFVILIPFLVSMAVFTHLSILEFSLPPDVGAGLDNSKGKPELKITVVVADHHVAITRGEEMLDSIPAVRGEYNYAALREKLIALRPQIEPKDEAIVAVRDKIKFQSVVNIMDQCRSAGFTKLGLSNATADPAKGA